MSKDHNGHKGSKKEPAKTMKKKGGLFENREPKDGSLKILKDMTNNGT